MSYDIVKSVSIDPVSRTVNIVSAANNVTPRTYESWNPLRDGSPFTFDTWLEAFASDCFGGSAQFLPSCESKAHEAYLVACDRMGGDWRAAYNRYGELTGDDYESFKRDWMRVFIDFILTGERDRRKFHMTVNGRTVTVSIRRGVYGNLTGCYRYTMTPKAVSWIRQRVITAGLPEFKSVVA